MPPSLIRPVRRKTFDPLFGGHAMGIIFLCVGLLLIGLNFYNQRQHQQLLDTGIITDATVIRIIKHDSGSGRKHHTHYYPVVRFTDTSGKEQLIQMTISTGPGLKKGDSLSIVYTPGNPKKMDLVQPQHTSGTLILAIAGGICALVGLGIIGANIHQSLRRYRPLRPLRRGNSEQTPGNQGRKRSGVILKP